MRLFTAIDIPEETRTVLGALLARLKPLARIQWSPVENLHITTKFIGEWPERRLDDLKSALGGVSGFGPVEIQIAGLGWFPAARLARVLYAQIECPLLPALAHRTGEAAASVGVPNEERVYSPHLTLGRIRENVPMGPLQKAVEAEPPAIGGFRAESWALFQSAAGRYTKLSEYAL
jgi:2'-5' RNA ligase